jgi:Fe-S cluster assembly protein SufD
MIAHVVQRSTAEATLIRQFAEEKAHAPSSRRAAAFERFIARGLPTRRLESWHYTDLRAAMKDAAPLTTTPDSAALEAARKVLVNRDRLGTTRLVLLNGRLVAELCEDLPVGVSIVSEEPALTDVDDPVVALNEAMCLDAYTLRVAEGSKIEATIEIVHAAVGKEPRSLYSRLAILLGAGSSASFVETFVGAGPGMQRNASTILDLGEHARARHAVLVEDDAELHIESQIGQLAAKAELNAFALIAGGALTRRQLFHRLGGKEAMITLGGLTLLDGNRRSDTTLQVVHAAEAGTSREFFRAIVDDAGIGTFQGKVIVENAAQKTDGAMKSQAVLLSPQSQMNAKPELEIFADDVVCGHGATVGSLDPEQLFYLMARGIAKDEAESMLLEAFGGDAIDRVEDETLAEKLRRPFRTWLARERAARVRGKDDGSSTEATS